jgi:ribosomal-protein-serine acetyltransferase
MFHLTIDNNLHIRIFHPDDAEELFRLLERNRARLRPWIHPSALPETAKATRVYAIECYFDSLDPLEAIETPYIDEVRPYFPPLDPHMEMGIWSDHQLIGAISLSVVDDDETAAEFGYWITAEKEGQGIVSRCVCALMVHAIDQMHVERFVIGCALNNLRSRAIPVRLGYRLQAVIPNGEVIANFVYDRVIYQMGAREWRKRARADSGNG